MVVKILTLAGSNITSRRSSAAPSRISRGGPGTMPTKSKSPGQGSSSSKSTRMSSVSGIAKCELLDVSVPLSSMSASPVRQIDRLIISPVFTWVTCSSMHAGWPSHSSAPSSPSTWAGATSAGASVPGSAAGAGSCAAAGSRAACSASAAAVCSVAAGAASSAAGSGAGVGCGTGLEGVASCDAGPAGACATGDAAVGLAPLASDFLGEGGPCSPEVRSCCRCSSSLSLSLRVW
mmetsp:Transcript_10564/g.23293  ORF Transcript_10564/g.23293 Transcript_10564/m.23293 type:complete len:234 (-) Transcript_10564:1257-1958(-)